MIDKMEEFEYAVHILAPRKLVWETMWNLATYTIWAGAGWPDGYYRGNWAKGETIKFLWPHGGTAVLVEEYVPYQYLVTRFIGILHADGTENYNADFAKGYLGITEKYNYLEDNGKTTVTIRVRTTPKWEKLYSTGWQKSSAKLKELCEERLACTDSSLSTR